MSDPIRIFRLASKPERILRIMGRDGTAGSGGDKFYDHDQMSASALWTVNHNLNKYPSVTVVDSGGALVEGYVTYISVNQLTVSFTGANAGHAYCN